jgi:hypothetical protein
MILNLRCLAILLFTSAVTHALACDPPLTGRGVARIESGRHVLGFKPEKKIEVGKTFAVDLAVCSKTASLPLTLRLSALMPEHRHGMNNAPSLRIVAPGQWRAEGLLLHMPGRWEFRIVLGDGRDADRLQYSVKVE